MRRIYVIATLLLGILSAQAQEKVMDIRMADGTSTRTRVADLKQISFLAIETGNQGLLLKTTGGETVAVRFEANPVVTVSKDKLTVKQSEADAMEFEITDIAEIQFGDASNATGIDGPEGFSCVVQDGSVLLRDIPEGVEPRIYSLDGRSLPTPPLAGGKLQLSRATLGKGIFVVKAGSFSAKIKL